MQLLLVRHGDPDYARDALTEAGRKEADALAARMRDHYRPDLLYTSPLGRARATLRPTEEALGKEGAVLDWAAELHLPCPEGPWGPGYLAFDTAGHWVRGGEGDGPLPSHDTWHLRPPFDGAPVREAFERVRAGSDAFLAGHGYERRGGRYACVAPHRRRIAVFCHHGLGLTWLAHLLEIPLTLMWSGFWLPPSSVTTVLFDERVGEWATPRCVGLGDLSHLHAGGLPRSNVGLKANRE